jgi:hypothetical protein
MRKQLVVISTTLLLAACGGGDDEDAASNTTTTRPETTTITAAPRTPHEAFLAGLEDSDATFDEGTSPETAMAAAQQVCEALDTAARSAGLSDDLTTTPGGHDLDQTFGDLEELSQLAAESKMHQIPVDFGEETGGIVLDLMAQHLCPQHFSAPTPP